MAGILTSESTIAEALDGAQSCTLAASDSSEASLNFRQLQASIQAEGFKVTARAPEGACGEFNAKTAAAETKPVSVMPQPERVPELVMNQQANLTFNNS